MSSFKRRIGAAADVKELEYISALHQTCAPNLRQNGTISSIDILRLLKSRINLNVTHEHTLRIVRGLGGGVIGEDVISHIVKGQEDSAITQQVEQEEKTKKNVAGMTLSNMLRRSKKQENEEGEIPYEPFGIEGQKGRGKKNHGLFHRRKKHDDDDDDDEDMEDPNDDVNAQDVEAQEFLDLVQITSILLIPTLARAGKVWKDSQTPDEYVEPPPPITPDYHGLKGYFLRKWDEYKKRDEQEELAMHESLNTKPATILIDVLSIMLKSVDTDKYPILNAALVRKLLMASGEFERAADRVLVDKMVEAAFSSSGLFDEEAFVNALTGDLSLWNVGCEDEITTSFFDVYGFESYREMAIKEEQDKEAAQEAARQQQVDESNHRLSKAGLSSPAGGAASAGGASVGAASAAGDSSAAFTKDNDEVTVEDDIVPSMVGVPAYDPRNLSISSAMSVSGMSVITMDSMVDAHPKAMDLEEVDEGAAYKLDRTHTPLDIDFAIDMHSSIVLTVLIFFFFMATALVYAALILQIPGLSPSSSCGKSFGCRLGSKVITWMVFAVILAATGYIVIIPLSLGNQPTERSPRRLMFAFVLGLIVTWVPFLAIQQYRKKLEPPYSGPASTVEDANYSGSQWLCRAAGILVCLVLLWQLILSRVGNQRIRANYYLRKFFSTSAVRGSSRAKRAATRKVNLLLENAHKLCPETASGHLGPASKDATITNFMLRGESFEEVGGLIWTWKRLLSRKLFAEDGVWIMSRLIIIQTAQLVLIIFFAYSGVLIVQQVAERAQTFQDDLEPGYPEWLYTFVPTPKQAQSALSPAVGVAVFVMIIIFLIYLPSYVRTIFQFRCGIRPSLKSSEFLKYRVAVDAVRST